MAQFFEQLSPELAGFIRKQPMFFVASAAAKGRVNLSPKGMNTLRVLDDKTVGYLDITGSGNETAAHALHDGRLTMMFCSFDDKPLILRLYGRSEVVPAGSGKFEELISKFERFPGERQMILLHIESLQTSCGFAVPRMKLIEHRETLADWAAKKGEAALCEYRDKKNAKSIDGLNTGLISTSTPVG
ncbi:MAG TPA: pyridoxamine 5'-phosphate oxidase family protein [Tepidisphaeraceae bacterium]|nr:pyridoxamine 5'-phosphate oxidase family protein [Tepidisphaeraceae bacterium]